VPNKKKSTTSRTLSELEALVHKAGVHLKSAEAQVVPSAPIPRKPEPVLEELSEKSDDELFQAAMNSLERVGRKQDLLPQAKIPLASKTDHEAEDRRLMQEAMNEAVPLPVPDHPEYIDGWIGVSGKQYLPNLSNGLYLIQGQIDLHGMNQTEAHIAVEEYISRMSRFHPCCIKIIHGRGINSPYDRSLLKDSLQRLLNTRKMSRYVLAYASSSSHDGGAGAIYVLLNRQ
jgi:DNA-nicking Smr family endonuclease